MTRPLPYRPDRQEDWLDSRFKGRFEGEACVVIGGGPSVADVAPEELLPCRFIAVNVAMYAEQLRPFREHCVAGLALDAPFLLNNLRQIVKAGNYPVFTGNTEEDCDALLEYLNALGVHRIPSNNTEGLGDSFARFCNGGNSGFAAIQLAVILGFKTIGLLGFDGGSREGKLYFHGEYHETAVTRAAIGEWCAQLDACAGLFELLGVRVRNLSAGSRLQSYPKTSAREWRECVADPPGAPASPRSVLLEKYDGRLNLGFRVNPSAAGYDGGERNTCYGGARNVAFEGRYRPIPEVLEQFHVPASGEEGDHLSANGRLAARSSSDPAVEGADVPRVLRESGISRGARGTPEVEEWIARVVERYYPSRDGDIIDLGCAKSMSRRIAGKASVLRAESASVAPLAECVRAVVGGRVALLVGALSPDSSSHSVAPSWVEEVLSVLSQEGEVLEYEQLGPWLTVALVQPEGLGAPSIGVGVGNERE